MDTPEPTREYERNNIILRMGVAVLAIVYIFSILPSWVWKTLIIIETAFLILIILLIFFGWLFEHIDEISRKRLGDKLKSK